MIEVVEKDTPELTISFFNESDEATAPSSATWKLVDIDTKTEQVAEAALTPIASVVSVIIPEEGTTILNNSRKYEKKKVIVAADFGSGRKKYAQYIFTVKNILEDD